MTYGLELVLLLVALLGVVLLLRDLLGGSRRRETERAHLERLAGADEEPRELLPERPGLVTRRLFAAGIRLSAPVFMLILGAFALLVFFGLLAVFPNSPAVCLLAALVAAYVVWMAVQEWGRVRGARFERKLIDGVDYMVSALLAGEVPTRALATAAAASEGTVQAELGEVVSRLSLGSSIREALARMVTRYDSEGVRLFSQTLAVKWHAGGDLAPVLRHVAWIMRERVRINMRLRTEMTGVQIASLGVALFPYILIPVFIWQRPDWVQLLTEHPWGPRFLGGAVILQIVGLVWLRRIVRIEL